MRTEKSSQEKHKRDHHRAFQRNGKHPFHRFPVAFPPILSGKNGRSNGQRRVKQVQHKLYLRRKGHGRKGTLIQHPQHQRVGGTHQRRHKILQRQRQNQCEQLSVKFLFLFFCFSHHIRSPCFFALHTDNHSTVRTVIYPAGICGLCVDFPYTM